MKSTPENPSSNRLTPGVSVEVLADAIHASGYPLQLQVAQNLSEGFYIQEEWSYIDHQTQVPRTIDLVASRELFEWKDPQPRVRPELNLVIECKQSDLPYVFFLSDRHPRLPDFPTISGLKAKNVVITSDDDPSSWHIPPLGALGLDQHSFLSDSVPFCVTFSKCVRHGKKLTLSGSDPYQNLMLPILKAADHFDQTQIPPPTAHYFDGHLVIGVGVLDAPMVGVRLTDSGPNTELLVPHPVSWTHVCATRHGVARIPRALRLACDTPAFRGASTGCSVRRTQRRPRAPRRGFERPGRRSLAP